MKETLYLLIYDLFICLFVYISLDPWILIRSFSYNPLLSILFQNCPKFDQWQPLESNSCVLLT